MSKDKRLYQKAMVQVVDDLIRAGFIKRSVVKDEARGRKSLTIVMTKHRTRMVQGYATALRAIQKPSGRKIDAFNGFLLQQAYAFIYPQEGVAEQS